MNDSCDDLDSRPAGVGRILADWARWGGWLFSAVLLAVLTACYSQRYDTCAFATLFPAWCGAVLGLAAA